MPFSANLASALVPPILFNGGTKGGADNTCTQNIDKARTLVCTICLSIAIFFCPRVGLSQKARIQNARIQNAIDAYTAAIDEDQRDQQIQKFNRAEQLFRQVIEGDGTNPPVRTAALYVNLGNAALQGERLGPAIVAFRQALALDPQNTQAHQNLAYARSLLPEWIRFEPDTGLADSFFFWTAYFSNDEIAITAAACFALGFLFGAFGISTGRVTVRNLAVVPLLAWIVLLVSLWFVSNQKSNNNLVVIDEAVVHSADSENSPTRVSRPLPSGAEVRLVQQRDRWTEIQFSGGRTGWLLSTKVNKIST